MPVAPPTEPRLGSSDSLDEIPVVSDEAPPSSGEVEIEPEEPTDPRAKAKLLALPAPPPVPSQATAPSPSPSPASPPAVAVAVTPSGVMPVAAPVATAPTPARVSSLPIAPSPPAVPASPVSQPQVQPVGEAASPSLPTRAAQPAVNIKDLPPMRALAPTEPEGLEVHFEDEEAVSATRSSEPEAEIAAEDLVSIESAPRPASGSKKSSGLQRDTPAHAMVPPMTAAAATAVAPLAPRISLPPPSSSGAKPAARMIVPTASPIAPPPMTDAPTGRRKARPWWEELFNDDFIRTMAKVTDAQIAKEVDFVEESLAVAKGAMLLDLGCGTGRHAIELTRRGYKVVGFDLSLPMLAKAAEEAQERGQKLNFVQGDMREMTFEDTFDGIYSWNTSFGFFEEDKNQQVIQRVHKALKKGGQFVLEVGNRDYIIRQAPSLAWFEGDGCICMDEMSIDWITSRMKVKRTMMMDDGRTKEIDYSVRIYSLHELGKILHDAGFRVAEVSGRCATPGVFFGSESPKTMILAEKK
jgi:SAM-dependent methyltransferase